MKLSKCLKIRNIRKKSSIATCRGDPCLPPSLTLLTTLPPSVPQATPPQLDPLLDLLFLKRLLLSHPAKMKTQGVTG
ncbi:hypothetical protein Tco_1162355 [Tanacetum coccineum]